MKAIVDFIRESGGRSTAGCYDIEIRCLFIYGVCHSDIVFCKCSGRIRLHASHPTKLCPASYNDSTTAHDILDFLVHESVLPEDLSFDECYLLKPTGSLLSLVTSLSSGGGVLPGSTLQARFRCRGGGPPQPSTTSAATLHSSEGAGPNTASTKRKAGGDNKQSRLRAAAMRPRREKPTEVRALASDAPATPSPDLSALKPYVLFTERTGS